MGMYQKARQEAQARRAAVIVELAMTPDEVVALKADLDVLETAITDRHAQAYDDAEQRLKLDLEQRRAASS